MSIKDSAIVSILHRRDAASVVAAVVLALIVSAFVISVGSWISGYIFETGRFEADGSFRDNVLKPLVDLLLQLVIFELLIRAYTALAAASPKR